MKTKRLSKVGLLVVISLIGLATLVSLKVLLDPEGSAAEAREQRIRELVPIGMDIDEAIELLRSEGFSVGDKYFPTLNKDYYLADITIRFKFTFLDKINITRHKGKVNKKWVSLKAGLDGVITSIK